ncbi:hypothetical protein LX32DRAFT_636862 [Colletotrichum zoysiae]|uniref:CCHC-type domain-containing protein n=1 Tax=Colletotrichum zoysiae TaxID=1216348 RepID=A0AAD9HPS5_9PEZI|nr:hypothetical protein LX32DRAFT_636862 [Colletotrichum zoysiae]
MAESTDGTGNRGRRQREEDEETVDLHPTRPVSDDDDQSVQSLDDVDDRLTKRVRTGMPDLQGIALAMSRSRSDYSGSATTMMVRDDNLSFSTDYTSQMVQQATQEFNHYGHRFGRVDTVRYYYEHKSRFAIEAESVGHEAPRFNNSEPKTEPIDRVRGFRKRKLKGGPSAQTPAAQQQQQPVGNNYAASAQSSVQASFQQQQAFDYGQAGYNTQPNFAFSGPMGPEAYHFQGYNGPMGPGAPPFQSHTGPMYPAQGPMGHTSNRMPQHFGHGRNQQQRGGRNQTDRKGRGSNRSNRSNAQATPSNKKLETVGRLGRHAVQQQKAGGDGRSYDFAERKRQPPWVGIVKMTADEQREFEIDFGEVFKGARVRFHRDNICSKCGHHGHWLSDCAFPDDSGFLYGCPVHNARTHSFDTCPDLDRLTEDQILWFLVTLRGNKAPLRTTMSWSARLRAAIDNGTWNKPGLPLPLTLEFVLTKVKGGKHGHAWLNFDYGKDSNRSLPKDPATSGNHRRVVQNRTLDEEVHRPATGRRAGDAGSRDGEGDAQSREIPQTEGETSVPADAGVQANKTFDPTDGLTGYDIYDIDDRQIEEHQEDMLCY